MNQNDLRNDKRFLRRFVTSYSILLIFMLLLGLFFYAFGLKDVKRSLSNQNVALLQSAITDMDTSFKQMSTLASQYASNSTIRHILRHTSKEDTDFYKDAKNAMDYLADFTPIEITLPINIIYIYLPNIDYLISSYMLSDSYLYYKMSKRFISENYITWKNEILSDSTMYSLISLKKYGQKEDTYFIYKIPFSSYNMAADYPGILCIEISRDKLFKKFSNIDLYKKGFLCVLDKNQNELFRINSNAPYDLSTEKICSLTKSSDSLSGITHTKLNNESVVLTASVSSYNDWTYVLVQPEDLAFEDLFHFQKMYILAIILSCAVCFLMILLVSKRNVKPIVKMNTELKETIDERKNLQSKLDAQKPVIISSYLSKIMKGLIISREEAQSIESFLSLPSSESNQYLILYVSVPLDQLQFFTEDRNNNISILKETSDSVSVNIIKNYLYESFGSSVYIYQTELNSFAVLLSTPESESKEDCMNWIDTAFRAMHDRIMKDYSVWIFGGAGNRTSNLSSVWKSFQQATQAANYVREGSIFMCYSNIHTDKSYYYFPVEMATQLANFIQNGNSRQITEIFHLIRKENYTNRTLSINMIDWLMSDIRNILLKVRFSFTENDDNREALMKADALMKEPLTLELLEQLSMQLSSIPVQKNDCSKLVSSIREYINSNYMDSSLSLKKISDEFDISESYFSYLFKVEIKQNFSEYLESLRMKHAMRLLKDTDISISDLYAKTGYNNANSFRRAFKKVYGVIPKTVRDNKGNN